MDLGADNGQSDSNDNGSVTFWMRNIKNHWIDNVAAGSKGVGYWFDMPKKYFVLNPLYTFKNNAAHSSATGVSMYPGMGLTVANKDSALLDGLRIWNNNMVGIMMFFSGGYKILNSVLVNNKVGIQDTFSKEQSVVIKDTRIIGSLSNPSIDAGLLYTYNNQMKTNGQEILKPELKNVTFSSFDRNSRAIKPYREIFLETSKVMGQPLVAVDTVFDATVHGSSRNPMPLAAELSNPWTMYVEDASGGFSPTGQPGFWVKNTPRLTHFIPQGSCTAVDSQTVFCENACLQHFLVSPQNFHLGLYKKMKLTNGVKSFEYLSSDSYNGQTFDVFLPPGTYAATFFDANGNKIVPPSVAIDKKKEPTRDSCASTLPWLSFETDTFRPSQAPTRPPFVSVDANVLDTIPEASDFQIAYELDIPTNPAYQSGRPLYSVDNHESMSDFSRVAYYLELDGDYVWISMNTFTTDARKIGVPCLSLKCGDGMTPSVFQQDLTNVNVVSNVAGLSGTGLPGNIEFWPYNYSPGSTGSFDTNDANTYGGNFGSMQIHLSLGRTVFAFNHFNDGSVADLGIGNSGGIGFGSDWSLAENADSYQVRTLKVFTNAQSPTTSTSSTLASTTTVQATTTSATTTTATVLQTRSPTPAPSNASTDQPTPLPLAVSTPPPSENPTKQPTHNPTIQPTQQSTPNPTPQPAEAAPSNSDPVKSLIPDANGYDLVYALDIPVSPAYKNAKPIYSVDNHQQVSGFTRIGYYLELDDKYVWVSFDAFTSDARKIGVPCHNLGCGDGQTRTVIQQMVTNVNVESNVPGLSGTGLSGNVEFWPFNYNSANSNNIHSATNAWDHGDTVAVNHGSFGSMQVHINGGGNYVGTVFAFNHFNDGVVSDVGIGNKPDNVGGLGPDWSFAQNAGSYSVRNMKVYVSDVPQENTLESTISDAAGYNLVYALDIPIKPTYATAPPAYTVDNSASISDLSFTRVAYLLELDDKYVWVSMGTFTDDASQIGVPCLHLQCGDGNSRSVFNQLVGNVNVVSNVDGLSGNSYVGNVEFWPYNYNAANSMGIPGALSSAFDWGDTPEIGNGSFGSMQVHVNSGGNYQGTIFAFNRFNDGYFADLGIGNAPSSILDWSVAGNAGDYSVRTLKVFVK
jgi:hypothetical protein